MREQWRQMGSMIWSAVVVHLKGGVPWFRSLVHSSSALVSSSGEQKTPCPGQRRCNSASYRSTWLIRDEYAGVKWSTNRERASSQRCTAGAVRVERLPRITWTVRAAPVCRPA